jgi:hypothetical protein
MVFFVLAYGFRGVPLRSLCILACPQHITIRRGAVKRKLVLQPVSFRSNAVAKLFLAFSGKENYNFIRGMLWADIDRLGLVS